MKKDNKERLFEMMGKLDTSFKVRLNEYDYSDSNSYGDYVDELKEFVNAVEDKDFNKAKRMLLNFENEGKMKGLDLYLSEYGEHGVKNWVSQSAKRKNKLMVQNMNEIQEDEFVVHGTYTVSNVGGYEIMLNDSGDGAKVRDAFGSDSPKTSDWLEIEDVPGEDTGEMEPVIDPAGYNIPLNQVMRK